MVNDIMEWLAEHENDILSGNRRTLGILVEKFNQRIDELLRGDEDAKVPAVDEPEEEIPEAYLIGDDDHKGL